MKIWENFLLGKINYQTQVVYSPPTLALKFLQLFVSVELRSAPLPYCNDLKVRQQFQISLKKFPMFWTNKDLKVFFK